MGHTTLFLEKMEKDPLLDELAEAIAQGPVIFTPDDSWEEKFEEVKDET